uniref:ATP synthase F0 subunit 6 n=1 Tax=Lebertia trifurcilla TaxID=450597 RepID=UPI00211443EF|nr:ATP synthase F0 subunit 6 [Lebertia trifurcilla]UTE89509.1 ATP synthase F0 subunit 6 [Lebertia trifurcilla]
MMTNLFSMFDPSSSIMNLNWFPIMMAIMMIPKLYLKNYKMNLMMNIFKKKMKSEISSMMGNSKKNSSLMMMFSIFISIFSLNMMSLFPFNFTIASQISITLTSAMALWMSFLILGWMKNTKMMMAHLLPLGTPTLLMPIMVLIELISQMIRPITLSVRLTSIMVAGHLLMSLLGSFSLSSMKMSIINSPMIMALTFMELCVAAIQAFVFMTLLTLYSTEIN